MRSFAKCKWSRGAFFLRAAITVRTDFVFWRSPPPLRSATLAVPLLPRRGGAGRPSECIMGLGGEGGK